MRRLRVGRRSTQRCGTPCPQGTPTSPPDPSRRWDALEEVPRAPPQPPIPLMDSLRRVPTPPRRAAALLPHPHKRVSRHAPWPTNDRTRCDHPPSQASTAHGISTTTGPPPGRPLAGCSTSLNERQHRIFVHARMCALARPMFVGMLNAPGAHPPNGARRPSYHTPDMGVAARPLAHEQPHVMRPPAVAGLHHKGCRHRVRWRDAAHRRWSDSAA